MSSIPLLAEEAWRDSLMEAGAPGAKREPGRAKPQLVVSSAEIFAGLTTPSAPASVASRHFLGGAATPPLRGGEYSRPKTSAAFLWPFCDLHCAFCGLFPLGLRLSIPTHPGIHHPTQKSARPHGRWLF